MDFAALVALLRNPGEDGLPDDIADQLETAYSADLSVREAKITQLTESNGKYEKEVGGLKAHNYDLLKQLPAPSPDDKSGDATGQNQAPADFDSLFEAPK